MKKIFTITIASCMLLLAVMNSCSKKEETPTPTPTPAPAPTYPPDNTLLVAGEPEQPLEPANCSLSGGTSQFYTMSAPDGNGRLIIATTFGQPSATKTYTVVFSQPADGNSVQLQLKNSTGFIWTAENGGKALITVAAGSGVKVSFNDLKFVKTGGTPASYTARASFTCM